ncbi:MAG: ABC transporter permease [Candidatus Saccharimonas sp.]
MIRISDATILAYTKLRTHRIRTGIAVGISGLLFGLIVAVIVITQGIYSSVEQFQDEGLNNRTILNVTHSSVEAPFDVYSQRTDASFVREVETTYKQRIATKQAAAKKYNVPFTASTDDPSPIVIDRETKQKVVSDTSLDQVDVQTVTNTKARAAAKPFAIDTYLKSYPSAKVVQQLVPIQPSNGMLEYMKDGKEPSSDDTTKSTAAGSYGGVAFPGASDTPPSLQVVDSSLAKPFLVSNAFDPTKGEIPVIIPYLAAEKLLGLEPLENNATHEQKLERMRDVRNRASTISASFCYRNTASQSLLTQARVQQDEIRRRTGDPEYVKPKLLYKLPSDVDCGAVVVASDTRTAAERKADDNTLAYQREIGEFEGDPIQQKITVRAVGVSSDIGASSQAWSMVDMVRDLFSSWLGYGTWSIPSDMLAKVPAGSRPSVVFEPQSDSSSVTNGYAIPESYLVEFSDRGEARKLLNSQDYMSGTFAAPFGSGVLIVDEMKGWVNSVLQWLFGIFGIIAIVILASIISRTIAEGRRESAVFRAIGASRADIGAIYGVYTLLLSLRITIFTMLLGIGIAFLIETLSWRDATLGARLAYAASDTSKEFHLFSLATPYLLWVVGAIFAAGIVSAILPILLGARRNPIGDMRNDS